MPTKMAVVTLILLAMFGQCISISLDQTILRKQRAMQRVCSLTSQHLKVKLNLKTSKTEESLMLVIGLHQTKHRGASRMCIQSSALLSANL